MTTKPMPNQLEAAVEAALKQHQQAQTEAEAAAAIERQQAEQAAIARFKLPFDEATIAVLPTLNFRFEEGSSQPIAWFEYQDLTIEVSQQVTTQSHWDIWKYLAKLQGIEVVCVHCHVYPNSHWAAYSTPAENGQDFLVWLHKAAHTPTPPSDPPKAETFLDPIIRREQRERFLIAALQGTLAGLTSTGVARGACLDTALFAIETADLVVSLMDATPLQRQVLSVLTLEQLTNWVRSCSTAAIVGTMTNEDHPVCRFLEAQSGLRLQFSNLALTDEAGRCVLGSNSANPLPGEIPLAVLGEWLPALLDWKTFDPDTETGIPTFTAGEVLAFLEPFQR